MFAIAELSLYLVSPHELAAVDTLFSVLQLHTKNLSSS